MRKLLFFIMLLIVPFFISGKELVIEKQIRWGGNGSESFREIIKTSDNCYLAIGYGSSTDIDGLVSNGNNDGVIVKFDSSFNIIWQKSWGGSEFEELYDVVELSSGDFIIVGTTRSSDITNFTFKGGSQDSVILRLDKSGNIIWQKSWGGNDFDAIYSLDIDKDGNIIIGAYSRSTDIDGFENNGKSDAFIIKMSPDGEIIWERSWGGNSIDMGEGVFVDNSNSYILYGHSMSTDINGFENKGEYDIFLIKYDTNGNKIWEKSWGGSKTEYVWDMKVSSKNEYILIGNVYSTDINGIENKGGCDSIIMKYDEDGNIINIYHFGASANDNFNTLALFENDDIFIGGNFTSSDIPYLKNNGGYDIFSHYYDQNGLVSSVRFGSSNYELSLGSHIKDNDIFLVGSYYSNDIDNLELLGSEDALILKYSLKYNLNLSEVTNGKADVFQKENKGIVIPEPNSGYDVDKIIVKNTKGEIIEVTKLEDGTYSFPLSDDVSIEVLFFSNPKTGVIDFISIVILGFTISLIGFILVKKNCHAYEI